MSQEDDSFDVLEVFGNAPTSGDQSVKDEKKKRRAEKAAEKAKLKAQEKLEKNRENREKKKLKKDKMKKRKRGEEVSDDSDQENEEEDAKEDKEDKEGEEEGADVAAGQDRPSKKAKTEKAKGGKSTPGIWIGNLSYSTSEADLKAYFSSCGEITRIKCPPGRTSRQKNQGFAFIDFATQEAVTAALAKSESDLNGRAILIKDSKNYEKTGRPKREAVDDDGTNVSGGKAGDRNVKKQKNPPSPTIFLGNLSFSATREAIKEQFEPCGRIRKVRLATFEDSGKCKGFAYIDFFDVESATKALRAPDKHTMDGRKLRLEYAGEAATKKATPWLLRQERKEAEAAANNESNDEPANLGNGGESNEGNFNEQEKNERLARKQERMERRKNAPVKEGRTNATSGEVLANVQRQKITAQPFKGTKITFD